MSTSKPTERHQPSWAGPSLRVKVLGGAWVLVNPLHIITIGPACSAETSLKPAVVVDLVRSHMYLDHDYEDVERIIIDGAPEMRGGGDAQR